MAGQVKSVFLGQHLVEAQPARMPHFTVQEEQRFSSTGFTQQQLGPAHLDLFFSPGTRANGHGCCSYQRPDRSGSHDKDWVDWRVSGLVYQNLPRGASG